ncbi:hypothetical protein QBC46DRAFT_320553 [Diplogelasinospora grovesii]|uniref:NAD-dependent epimerase/dehydratase domain-containing protein n=1 Tax=Diplogelasinospora grovesii TaxID=303347 RepID=A0AAN6S1G6_9PEZI|nr:hypothetical protein QBC46DRAFT_320553 [Diplogelasinospora grovesii]
MGTPQKGLVLITGADTFIGAHAALAFLNRGFLVRGTVQNMDCPSVHGLRAALETQGYEGRFELIEVPSIKMFGALHQAVVGKHHASAEPGLFPIVSADEAHVAANAARDTIVHVIESVRKEPGIKSFVLLSNVEAVASNNNLKPNRTYTEKDWNETRLPKNLPLAIHEMFSILTPRTEKAFWRSARGEGIPDPGFTMTAICSGICVGPPVSLPFLPHAACMKSLRKSAVESIWDIYNGKEIEAAGASEYQAFVDVRDLASLMVGCIVHPSEADQQRVIAASTYTRLQDVAELLRSAWPERAGLIKTGAPYTGYQPPSAFPGHMPFSGVQAAMLRPGRSYCL